MLKFMLIDGVNKTTRVYSCFLDSLFSLISLLDLPLWPFDTNNYKQLKKTMKMAWIHERTLNLSLIIYLRLV